MKYTLAVSMQVSSRKREAKKDEERRGNASTEMTTSGKKVTSSVDVRNTSSRGGNLSLAYE